LAGSDPSIRWTAESRQQLRRQQSGRLEIYQDSSGGVNWRSAVHVNRNGEVPCRFRGYRLRSGASEEFGERASPTICLSSDRGSLAVAVPEFWQQFPKAAEVENGLVRVRLFPGQFGDLFELQGGEQKSHTLWLHFGPAEETPSALAWVHEPARVRAAPEWYAASKAFPLGSVLSGGPAEKLEPLLARALRGGNSFFARREVVDEYGWRNFGDVFADHEQTHYPGPGPLISHYNNQFDMIYGFLLHFLRGGDPDWFCLADDLARHVIDIDIYHTTRDKWAYNGGLFWHTDHYKHAHTSTHRAYSVRNRSGGAASYGGGPGCEHNYTTGLVLYYYLTGDRRAFDTVRSLADWVIQMDDGRKSRFALLDDAPTGLASATAAPTYHGPGRGSGNSLNAVLDGWTLTGERKYLDFAELLIRRCIHPHDDVPARDLLNLERRWSYTVFLVSLDKYLDLKAEAGELDFMYSYTRASLLHYAQWMLREEKPYFDQVEKLEYPTEAWAAQEFRKANVFRRAARHAAEPLRTQFYDRGDWFASRAWQDLLRFETRTNARTLAIVMVEGLLDSALAVRDTEPAPRAEEGFTFGVPEPFVRQRQRIRQRLRSFRGLADLAARLLNPLCWYACRATRPN
jgi:hypothetical protein